MSGPPWGWANSLTIARGLLPRWPWTAHRGWLGRRSPVAVTVMYLAGGRSTDYPPPVVLRNASVVLQVWVAARVLRRQPAQ